jgi:hypothetical protein
MNEERIQILKMIESGKISADEAAKLFEAMEAPKAERSALPAKTIKIRVIDGRSGKKNVDINLPISLVGVAMRFIPRDQAQAHGVDLDEITRAIREGTQGRILEVVDPEKNQRVEIFLE